MNENNQAHQSELDAIDASYSDSGLSIEDKIGVSIEHVYNRINNLPEMYRDEMLKIANIHFESVHKQVEYISSHLCAMVSDTEDQLRNK